MDLVSSSYVGGGSVVSVRYTTRSCDSPSSLLRPLLPPCGPCPLRLRLVRIYRAVISAPPSTIAPMAIPIPAPAAALSPPDFESEDSAGVESGRASVAFGSRGLFANH